MTTTATRTRTAAPADKREPNAVTLAVRDAHAEPRFNLAEEPWLPVIQADGTLAELNLRDLLLNAHRIADLTESDPLTRAALRRYLTAIAYIMTRDSGDDEFDWADRLDDNTGFTAKEVDTFLASHEDHLWLYHPKTPFLQDHRLTELGPVYGSKSELVPSLPEDNSKAWFIKPGDPALDRALTPARAARGLVYRWFYALPGNAGKNTHGSNPGSVFSHTIAPITHAFRISPTLFSTLLRNIPAHDKPGKTPAWLDKTRPKVSRDWLYNYTLTMAGTVLGPPDDNGNITHVLRGPVVPNTPQLKENRDAVRTNDPHQCMILPEKTTTPTILRVTPAATRLDMIRRLKQSGTMQHTATTLGITSPLGPWLSTSTPPEESMELLLASKGGTGSSPTWEDSTIIRFPESVFADPDTDAQARLLLDILSTCFAPRDGIEFSLRTAIYLAHRRVTVDGSFVSPDSATVAPFQHKATQEWLMSADRIVSDALLTPQTATDAAKHLASQIAEAALTVFHEQTDWFRFRSPSAAPVMSATDYLQKALRDYRN